MWRIAAVLCAVASLALVAAYTTGRWPFETHWVQILRSSGRPIHGATVVIARPGLREADWADATDAGDGWIGIPRKEILRGGELRFTAAGCGVLRGDLPRGRKVVLPDGIPATVTVPGDFPLPQPPTFLKIELEALDEPQSWAYALNIAVAPPGYTSGGDDWDLDRNILIDPSSRSALLLLPRLGRWHVRWSVMHVSERIDGGAYQRSASGSGPPGRIVEFARAGDTVAVPIDQKTLAEHSAR